LVVRDVQMTRESVEQLRKAKTDLPLSEVKWEAAIDRVTSAATPRQMERVPAGAVFGPAEMVYSIYEDADIDRFADVVDGMQLLQDDYLGGSGSRGSGKVVFQSIDVYTRARGDYKNKRRFDQAPFESLDALTARMHELLTWLKTVGVPVEARA
jgi:CRISPR-associated protein Csm3